MNWHTDGWGRALETGRPVSRANAADIRRFRLRHALASIENALILLDDRPAEGIEIAALERVRNDLGVVLRMTA
jgi:hypothetical protein